MDTQNDDLEKIIPYKNFGIYLRFLGCKGALQPRDDLRCGLYLDLDDFFLHFSTASGVGRYMKITSHVIDVWIHIYLHGWLIFMVHVVM